MQFQVRESDDSCQPGAQYTNPRVVVQERHGAPLLNCSGLVLVRQLIERLGVAPAIDAGVRVLRRCKWYRESEHILTLIYSMLSGGSKLQDVNRLGQDDALKRVLGSERIPHATTIASSCGGSVTTNKTSTAGLTELRETTEAVQQDAFGMLDRERRRVATLDWDSSIHEVYGRRRKGRTTRTTNLDYSALYGTLAETGEVLYLGLAKAIGTPATGPRKCCRERSTGEQALSEGADARRQRLLQPSAGADMRAAGGGVLHRRQAAQEPDERRTRDPGEPLEVVGQQFT